MTVIGILLAFLAGIVSFASPCCLPLVPAYVGYMVGAAPDGVARRRMLALRQALAFVLGFSVVFVGLWASVGLIGYVFRDYAALLRQVGGAVIVFLGLNVAGIINFSAFYRELRLPVGLAADAGMGFGMGFGWIIPLVVIGLVAWAVVALARSRGAGHGGADGASDRALAILRERFAKGELDAETYRRMRDELAA